MFSRVLGNSSYVVSFFCFLEVDGIVPFLTIRGNVPQLLIIPATLFYFSASLKLKRSYHSSLSKKMFSSVLENLSYTVLL